jgi:hypothetical protein
VHYSTSVLEAEPLQSTRTQIALEAEQVQAKGSGASLCTRAVVRCTASLRECWVTVSWGQGLGLLVRSRVAMEDSPLP